ncbi:MAG: sigma-70 family RNA polymerase sigma factor, partial [Phycisphaerae bacterium]|nr:RNA polymerase sigma factor [Phycisphaerae bacterium]NIR67215.1 RNA polymerase sigma factor [candidate division Zixibacteria bacterium]NIS52064.1 RNA polymerase sigma factor [Phycisphaerae bacterium]NIU09603.1 RNA polymerase sigma factor [Phycisphaerae bacterium]NIU57266.1 sigma-70 family RNA polymerase sigma factor [Phycisphaerae bacterium]
MEKNVDYVQLVTKAQLGDKESLNRLAEAVEERLYAYVYRYTLSEELTEDIVQESILKMLEVLNELKEADRFWPWLFKIALNKIFSHRRAEHKRKNFPKPVAGLGDAQRQRQTAIANVVGQELKEIVFAAMQKLKPEHRAVINMRCYDEMGYSEIAKTIGCSEFAAQMLFYRAKKSLKKQLSRRGFGKGSLLMALVLFGKMTAPSEAAAAKVAVMSNAVKVGVPASLAAMAASKTAVLSLTMAGVLAVGTMAVTSKPDKTIAPLSNKPVGSSLTTKSAADSIKECWYYYPPNGNGAVMTRLELSAESMQSYCQWLQTDQSNYYRRKNTIYVENYRIWHSDLSVWRLPTDNRQLTDFLSQVEGKSEAMRYVPHRAGGLVIVVKQDQNGNRSQITHRRDISDEEYFRYKWPAGAKVVDNRDVMHRRGWTYFNITGQIDEKEVRGRGRIPLIYAASNRHWPWVELKIGENVVNEVSFAGLSRPWMGLHTIDTI